MSVNDKPSKREKVQPSVCTELRDFFHGVPVVLIGLSIIATALIMLALFSSIFGLSEILAPT